MRKIAIAGMLLALVSCKKTWQCECHEIHNWEDWNPIVTNVAIEDEKEKDANTLCHSLNYDLGSGNYKTCTLK